QTNAFMNVLHYFFLVCPIVTRTTSLLPFQPQATRKAASRGEFSGPVCICILSKRWIDCVVFPHVFGPTNTVCWANGHAQRDELAAIGISSPPSPEGGARQR